jgi:hypothetical protein
MPNREQSRPSLLARTVAPLAVALVLVLTVLAASPDLHERLHGQGPGAVGAAQHDRSSPGGGRADDEEDGCVVTLFAQGLVLPLALLVLVFSGQTLSLLDFYRCDRVIPAAPRYLLLPSQAPPVGLS